MLIDDSVAESYDDVRSDSSDTNWLVLQYSEDGRSIVVAATGEDFDAFKQQLTSVDRSYGYLRLITGDEMSKRAKFALMVWVGSGCNVIQKGKMSTDKADVKKVIQTFSTEMIFEESNEIREENIRSALEKAGGANYGSGR